MPKPIDPPRIVLKCERCHAFMGWTTLVESSPGPSYYRLFISIRCPNRKCPNSKQGNLAINDVQLVVKG